MTTIYPISTSHLGVYILLDYMHVVHAHLAVELVPLDYMEKFKRKKA